MSNYMYPDMSGSGIDDPEHDDRCATRCRLPLLHYADEHGDEFVECLDGHGSHDACDCEELARARDD